MYEQYLQNYVNRLSAHAGVDADAVTLLNSSLACFLATFGRAINAETQPQGDLLGISVLLLLLDNGLDALQTDADRSMAHYIIGLGFEQTGALLARIHDSVYENDLAPLANDHWYRLSLAYLHYLCGGYRVQALSVLRQLGEFAGQQTNTSQEAYGELRDVFQQLYSGNVDGRQLNSTWSRRLLGQLGDGEDSQLRRMRRLVGRIRARREVLLQDLGQGNEAAWLSARGLVGASAVAFWRAYLNSLNRRNITTFTPEQRGPERGFDTWLRLEQDLLVVLPTGSGKTIVGELRAALTLAGDRQVIWIAPTRALVRQTRTELRRAFVAAGVIVDELPTTEDFLPLNAEARPDTRVIAVTTPEKLLALIRANPSAVANVGLVILDEAQILLKGSRGTTAESVLQQIHQYSPNVKYVLMTAFQDVLGVLTNLLQHLRTGPTIPAMLVSDVRPTRRIYGVLTNDVTANPIAAVYPAGIQTEATSSVDPFYIIPKHIHLSQSAKELEIAQKFLRPVTKTSIRSVLFVTQNASTQAQATKLARASKRPPVPLPAADMARLRLELGRPSVVEATAAQSVAPHHAGLTALELYMVEKWIRDGRVRTVVATPTLAEGVNLPFDLSIVSFWDRYNSETKRRDPLSTTEIQNMLGRAGRAGYVSDGVCLLAVRSGDQRPKVVLDRSRHFFFHVPEQSSETAGLARLLEIAIAVPITDQSWLAEFTGTDFSEAQQLISFVVTTTQDHSDKREALTTTVTAFPSIGQLSDNLVREAVSRLVELSNNIDNVCTDGTGNLDSDLMVALRRTGMPVELLKNFVTNLRASPDIRSQTSAQQFIWADHVVLGALVQAKNRKWFTDVFGTNDINSILNVMQLWRAGEPISLIERTLKLNSSEVSNRIAVGKFLSRRLALIAQFWGALAVCAETFLATQMPPDMVIKRLQTFVREGVASIVELEWLRAIGHLDRVLAHRLAAKIPLRDDRDSRIQINEHLAAWRDGHVEIPDLLTREEKAALQGVLGDL